MKTPTPSRADFDFSTLEDDATLQELITKYNKLIKGINFLNKFLSIQSNFDGYVASEVTIPATSSVKIQHFLGVIPKWRIILKQTGNGVITDIPEEWTDKVITLYNNGAVAVKISVFIARE